MKALKGVLITLVVIIAIVGVTVIGGYVYVRATYGIDLFRTAGQLKTLSKGVDESALCRLRFPKNRPERLRKRCFTGKRAEKSK